MSEPYVLMPTTNQRILELLHIYRFLTPKQFLRLGVTTHKKSLQRVLKRFTTWGKYVDFADFGVLPGKGRLPRVYFLNRRGAEYLAGYWGVDPATIDYPKGGLLYIEDYFHRMATVDFEIELRLFLEQKGAAVDFFRRYFDAQGANRSADPADRLQRPTKVPLGDSFFIPDGIFRCSAPDGPASSTPSKSITAMTPAASTISWKSTRAGAVGGAAQRALPPSRRPSAPLPLRGRGSA